MREAISYRDAAEKLWGEAGAYVHDTYARNLHLFPGLPEEMPIVIGLTAYGRCLGLTRGNEEAIGQTRITIASNLFTVGRNAVADVMVHEMLHAWLIATGKPSDHDAEPWYAALRELSPVILGKPLDVRRGADRKSVRIPNPNYVPGGDAPRTTVRKVRVSNQHEKVSRWPGAFRPESFNPGPPIHVPTY